MSDNEEERLLLQRESSKHEERIQKAKTRDKLAQIKVDGYNRLAVQDEALVKVFLGYALELHPEHSQPILDGLAVCISTSGYYEKIQFILSSNMVGLEDILTALIS